MTESVTLAEDVSPETACEPWTEKTFLIEDRFPFVDTRDQALRCFLLQAFHPEIETKLMVEKMESLFQWVKHGVTPSDARPAPLIRRV
jgi:hypothetical protein